MTVGTRSSQERKLVFHPDLQLLEGEVRRVANERQVRELEIEDQRINEEVPNNNVQFEPQPRPKTIGSFDEPHQSKLSLGIVAPPLEDGHIELKPSTLALVERQTFKGDSIECPLEHLDRFDRICKVIYMRNVSEETKKMFLFPFSLEDKASYWERSIPSSKVSTWSEIKREFLSKFYPKEKTARIRNDIRSFHQLRSESLDEAWDRFKGLTRSCPHHGMNKENLLGIFYRGVQNEVRRALDIASNGSFASLNAEQAETLIDNFAQSDSCFGEDYERGLRKDVASLDEGKSNEDLLRELSREIERKLCDEFDKLERMLVNGQTQASRVNSIQQDLSQQWNQQGWNGNECDEGVAYVSYQGEHYNPQPHPYHYQADYNNFQHQNCPNSSNYYQTQPNPNDLHNPPNPSQQTQNPRPTSFPNPNPRPTNPSFNPRPQGGNLQGYKQPRPNYSNQQWGYQQPQGGSSSSKGEEKQLDTLTKEQRELKDKVEAFISRNSPSLTSPNSFPAKPETNPKPSCSTLVYGMLGEVIGEVDDEAMEETVEEGKSAVVKELPVESSVAKVKEKGEPSLFANDSSVEVESKRIVNDFVKALSSPHIGDAIKGHFLLSKLVKDVKPREVDYEKVVEPIFKEKEPKVLTNREKDALYKARKSLKDLGIHVERGKDLNQVRAQLEFVKSILVNKDKVEELVETYDSSTTARKVLKKNTTSRMFTFPCSLGDYEVGDAFCDSGSYVNVISAKMAQDFKLEGMQPCGGKLIFGDQSIKYPSGVFKDFPIKVGDVIVPTDLLVLDMEGGKNQALLLGTPFLITVGAKMDFVNRVVNFEYVDKDVFYPLEESNDFEGSIIYTVHGVESGAVSTIEGVKIEATIDGAYKDDKAKGELNSVNKAEIDVVFAVESTNEAKDNVVSSSQAVTILPPTKKTRHRNKTKSKVGIVNEDLGLEAPTTPIAIPLVFKPTALVDGKLECKVRSKNGAKPFHTVRVVLDSVDDEGNGGTINEKMIRLFGMHPGGHGPVPKNGPPPFDH